MSRFSMTLTSAGVALFAFLLPALSHAKKKPAFPTVRWIAGAPGCTFERRDSGHYAWTMSDKDLDVTLVVDFLELAKSRQRFYHPFSLFLGISYKGRGSFEFEKNLWLYFVRHHNVSESYLDPSDLQNRLQNGLDSEVFNTERRINKNPAMKDAETALLQKHQKIAAEFIDFLTTQSLEPATLNPGNPEAQGWVFFGTSNKWIGPWKKREDFILEVRMKDKIWQFPFSLPPTEGDLILRKPQD